MEDQLLEKIGESNTVTKVPNHPVYFIQEKINKDINNPYQKLSFTYKVKDDYYTSGITDISLVEILLDRVATSKKFELYRNELNFALLTVIDYLEKIENHG